MLYDVVWQGVSSLFYFFFVTSHAHRCIFYYLVGVAVLWNYVNYLHHLHLWLNSCKWTHFSFLLSVGGIFINNLYDCMRIVTTAFNLLMKLLWLHLLFYELNIWWRKCLWPAICLCRSLQTTYGFTGKLLIPCLFDKV